MAKRQPNANAAGNISAQPRLQQHAREIQAYGTVSHALPLEPLSRSAWRRTTEVAMRLRSCTSAQTG